MDPDEGSELDERPYDGHVRVAPVPESYSICLCQMHKLKRKIGSLSEAAQLSYLNNWLSHYPGIPDQGASDQVQVVMTQAFSESDRYFFDFVQRYRVYLTGKVGQGSFGPVTVRLAHNNRRTYKNVAREKRSIYHYIPLCIILCAILWSGFCWVEAHTLSKVSLVVFLWFLPLVSVLPQSRRS